MKRDMIVPFPTSLGLHTTSAAESRVFAGDNFARVSGDAAETQLFTWDSEREKLGGSSMCRLGRTRAGPAQLNEEEESMFYVVLRCIWYRQKTRGRSPALGGRFPPKRKKSIDLETVVLSMVFFVGFSCYARTRL